MLSVKCLEKIAGFKLKDKDVAGWELRVSGYELPFLKCLDPLIHNKKGRLARPFYIIFLLFQR